MALRTNLVWNCRFNPNADLVYALGATRGVAHFFQEQRETLYLPLTNGKDAFEKLMPAYDKLFFV